MAGLFQCDKCSYRMQYKKALDNHMRRDHQKETFLKCRHCGFTAFHYDNMKKHIPVVQRKEK